jgi:hypothetical protein
LPSLISRSVSSLDNFDENVYSVNKYIETVISLNETDKQLYNFIIINEVIKYFTL